MRRRSPDNLLILQVGRFLESRSAEVQLLCGEVARSVTTGMLASQQVARRIS